MCGLCGYISYIELEDSQLKKMNDTMVKRGPNDSGQLISEIKDGFYLGLAHRRLSILDLSELGHQPMFSDNHEVCIVFNGEIYNFLEIKQTLETASYKFKSHCDTEVILNAYLEYGTDFLNKLNGMYSIALFDFKKQQLLLARDRIGEKPLYYYWNDGTLIFGSELKPFMEYPEFKKEINKPLISKYLATGYFASPDTVFKHTYKVEPGQYLIWKDGMLKKYTYWNILKTFEESQKHIIYDYHTAHEQLKHLIFQSVEKRLVADVPVGLFLSGGVDSALLAAVAKHILKEDVRTYTIGFDDAKQNEAIYAKEIARYLGTKHQERYVNDSDLLALVEYLSETFDEPNGDYSQIGQMLVAKMAKADITVALSGTGADEVFCGYKSYDWLHTAQKWDKTVDIARCILRTPKFGDWITEKCPPRLKAILENGDKRFKTQFFTNYREMFTRNMVQINSDSAKSLFEAEITNENWQIKRMLLDLKTYVPDEILAVADRTSMAYSLEVRNPLLDYKLVEFSFRISHDLKYHNKEKKYLLKKILYDMIPQELLDRPKHGFSAPVGDWLRGPLNTQLKDVSTEYFLKKQDIFNFQYLQRMIYKLENTRESIYETILWSYLVFQLWYSKYIA